MIISGLRCSKCGEGELIAIWPDEPSEQHELFRLLPYRRSVCWCEACWLHDFAAAPKPAPLRRRGKAKAAALAQD